MKEQLSPTQEQTLREFTTLLSRVNSIADMFPDQGEPGSGNREPKHPNTPQRPSQDAVLAPVYDLESARTKRSKYSLFVGNIALGPDLIA